MNVILICIIVIYFLINISLSVYFYLNTKKYYRILNYQELREGRKNLFNLHDKYPEFSRKDKITIFRIVFGFIFLIWIKIISIIFATSILYLSLKIIYRNNKPNKSSRKFLVFIIRFICKIGLIIAGIRIKIVSDRYVDVYKKYLGDNYDFDDQQYSSVISNHVSWYEILYFLVEETPGFISKESVRNFYFIGYIAEQIDSLFLDRTNEKNRNAVADKVIKRQEDFINGENHSPLVIFPEGTTTMGKHILRFKKGAFQNLMPVKPYIFFNKYINFSVNVGSMKLGTHLILSFCYLYHDVYVYKLPIINPTNFMFEKYNSISKSKWEIYSEVTRQILCEISGFDKSERTFRDSLEYISKILGKQIINT